MGAGRAARVILPVLLALAVPAWASAPTQTPEMTLAYRPSTGQPALDAALPDINHYAERHPDAFLDELEWFAGAGRKDMAAWLAVPGHQAADLFLGCHLAAVRGQSCAVLMQAFDAAGEEGWAAVARTLEPRPDRAQWQQVAQRLRDACRRWARPVPASLRGTR